VLLILALFFYLGLFTWNLRTGVLDRLAGNTGLEFVGWVLKPGVWTYDQCVRLWERYIYLVGVEEENERLQERIQGMTLELSRYEEYAAETIRLRRLLKFSPPQMWTMEGARIISQKMGPGAVLKTVLLDKGWFSGVKVNTPVAVPEGVVGRVLKTSPSSATALLLTDPNSKIPVLGQVSRTTGILTGRGSGRAMALNYVPLNDPLDVDETLITSGLAGIFPKGMPVARITSIERSKISLFQTVQAEPLVSLKDIEEVLLLLKHEARFPPALTETGNASNGTGR
jgi:rod shape-determining protein MreC